MTAPDATPVKDFTIRRPPIRFTIDEDTFSAPPIMGGFMMKRFGELNGELQTALANISTEPGPALEAVATIFKVLIPGDSGDLFAARLMSDGAEGNPKPIDLLGQALPVMNWMLEQYGLRPTEPSSPSSDGSQDGNTPSDGISSTDGA